MNQIERKCSGCNKRLSLDPCVDCHKFYCYDCFPKHTHQVEISYNKSPKSETPVEFKEPLEVKEDTFKNRNTGGNKGEEAAEKYFKQFEGLTYHKYGFDLLDKSINVGHFMTIPQFVRCTPDYVTVYNDEFTFIEVKGCGSSLKIKLTDFVEYGKWANIANFKLLVANDNDVYVLKYEELLNYLSTEGNKFGRYKDNSKFYFEIPLEKIQKFKK